MPDARRTTSLRDVLVGLKDGTHGTHARVSPGVPLLSAKNVTEVGLVWGDDDEKISEADFRAIDRAFSVAAQDLLLTVVGSLGRRALHDGSRVAFQRSVAFLRPDRSQVTPGFLYHITGGFRFQRELARRSNATAQAGVYLGQLAGISIEVPPLPEQRQIAAILDTVDEAIRKTEQIIAKLKQVKQGLLHDILTRGIDDNGELRDPERYPEQFKDSPLGRVPKAWSVTNLGNEARILHGYAFEGRFFTDRPDGPLLLTPGNFNRDGGLYFTDGNAKYFLGRVPSGYTLTGGDLVTVMTDLSPKTLILGRAVVIGEGFEALHNQRIGKVVTIIESRWLTSYLCHALNADTFRRRIIREATGTTVRHTSPRRILSSFIARPELTEQKKACDLVFAQEMSARREEEAVLKLRSLKSGLMDDLLTGRVRVTNILESAAP